MATISTRVDDLTKSNAERIANEIGIPLSTAINIFLKRFISAQGFPFSVTSPQSAATLPVIDTDFLDSAVKAAVSNPNSNGKCNQFTYLDPQTNELITVVRKE